MAWQAISETTNIHRVSDADKLEGQAGQQTLVQSGSYKYNLLKGFYEFTIVRLVNTASTRIHLRQRSLLGRHLLALNRLIRIASRLAYRILIPGGYSAKKNG